MKRGLVLFLALIMLIGCLAACGPKSETPGGSSEIKEDREADAYLPKKDYSGKTYTVLYRSGQIYEEEWISDSNKGADVINDAIASRNQAVIDRYGVKLDYKSGQVIGSDFDADFLPKITTNTTDDNFQLVAGNTYRLAEASVRGYFLNWLNPEQVPTVDLTAEWWDYDFTREARYNGCSYVATGPLSLTDMYSSACIFFNKTLLEKFKGPTATEELFDLVENGGWTLDKLIEYAAECTDKVSSDETDSNSIYGLATNWNNQIDAYIYASNLVMTERKNGTIVLKTVDANNRILDLAAKLQAFHQDSGNVIMFGSKVTPERVYKFVEGKSVFCTGILQSAKDIQNSAKELLYGVIPYPKYDEAQEEYHTYKLDFKTVFCIPRSVKEGNREFVGTITEALAYYSNKYVRPALYEKVLKHKNVQDAQSSKMIDKILDGGLYEFANIYAYAWGDEASPAHLLRKIVEPSGKGKNFSTEYSSNLKRYNASLKKLLDDFKSDDVAAPEQP